MTRSQYQLAGETATSVHNNPDNTFIRSVNQNHKWNQLQSPFFLFEWEILLSGTLGQSLQFESILITMESPKSSDWREYRNTILSKKYFLHSVKMEKFRWYYNATTIYRFRIWQVSSEWQARSEAWRHTSRDAATLTGNMEAGNVSRPTNRITRSIARTWTTARGHPNRIMIDDYDNTTHRIDDLTI